MGKYFEDIRELKKNGFIRRPLRSFFECVKAKQKVMQYLQPKWILYELRLVLKYQWHRTNVFQRYSTKFLRACLAAGTLEAQINYDNYMNIPPYRRD